MFSGGEGQIYGVDFSPEMVKTSRERLHHQIQSGYVVICEASVEKLPYNDNMFDKVFHVNCFYFWPDMTSATRELYRVMKPSSKIVTIMNPAMLKKLNERHMMKFGNTDPNRYIEGLQSAGFINIDTQELNYSDKMFQVILAHVDSLK